MSKPEVIEVVAVSGSNGDQGVEVQGNDKGSDKPKDGCNYCKGKLGCCPCCSG